MSTSHYLLLFLISTVVFPVSVLDATEEAPLVPSEETNAFLEQVEQFRLLRGEAGAVGNAELIGILRRYAADDDWTAKVLFADALVMLSGTDPDMIEAEALYREGVEVGVPGAFIGLARLRMMEASDTQHSPEIMELLLQASERGVAEADRIMSQLMADRSIGVTELADAWDYLVRAALREDTSASVELADAYLSGEWRGVEVPLDEDFADWLLLLASRNKSPEAAFRRSLRLSRADVDCDGEDYEESVSELYNAFLWSHEKRNTALIEDMERLFEQGCINPRTWYRARFMYENTINPVRSVQISSAEALEVRERSGVRQQMRIEGSGDGCTLSVMGFAYDSPYLWEGAVEVQDNGALVVASDDAFWPSVIKQREVSDMPCYIRVLDGAYAGFVFYVHTDWVAGEDRQIILGDVTYVSFLGERPRIALGQWRSLHSVFGKYNRLGLKPGSSEFEADQIILFNSAEQRVERFYFDSGLMAWVWTDDPGKEAADVAIPPWQAIFVLRRETAPLILMMDGVVSEAPATLPVDPGFNLVANIEGRLLEGIDSAGLIGRVFRADEFPVFIVDEFGALEVPAEPVRWWCLFGLSPETPVFANVLSAFFLTEACQTEPFYLQR